MCKCYLQNKLKAQTVVLVIFYSNTFLLCSSHNKDYAADIAFMSLHHLKVQGIYFNNNEYIIKIYANIYVV